MKGNLARLEMDGRPVSIYLPEAAGGPPLPVIYMLAGPDPALELTGALEKALEAGCRPFAAAAVGTTRWNSDYSPWPADPVFKNEPPFTGGAGAMLGWLTGELLPRVEETFPEAVNTAGRMILGYSLAGLTALYAMYATDAFSACGCCSGSLWYDGWTDFMAARRLRPGARVYLSLGKNEEKAKNPRMTAVGDAARAAYDMLSRDGSVAETALDMNDGGHFSNVPERLGKAIRWLVR